MLDDSGSLDILELSFDCKRVYWIQNVPIGHSRGFHAHKALSQVFIMISGSMRLSCITPKEQIDFNLSAEDSSALMLPPGYWRVLSNFSTGAICLVLASEHYDESDYLRSFDKYVDWFNVNVNLDS